ncbi:hypothetical protein ACFSCX_25335 [Bacillus salitolerans]|uniref:Uncharacterized protein n=1 Tax=Bacillus salitolerans TaxID=1437434 RepID=A0ABW4LYZ3_9BACI
MKIKVVTKDLPFPIRIYLPYGLVRFLTSPLLIKYYVKHIDSKTAKWLDGIDANMISELTKVFKEYRGTELVSVKDKDGTEVKITL